VSRDLSLTARQALYADATDEVFLILLTLSHDDLEAPIRVTSDAVETVSRGDTFVPFPFDLQLPDDQEGKAPKAKLVIDNVDRSIVRAIRSLSTAPTALIEIVRAAAPDTVEATFEDFRLINVTYDAKRVEGVLSIEDFVAEPYPAATFSPGFFPGMF